MRSATLRGIPTHAAGAGAGAGAAAPPAATTATPLIRIVVVTRWIAGRALRCGIGEHRILTRLTRGFRSTADLLNRALESSKRLSQGFNFPFVRRLLTLRFLDQFEQFVQRLDGVPQRAEHDFGFLDGQADGGRFGGLNGGRKMRGRRRRANLAKRPRWWLATFGTTRLLGRRFKRLGRRFVGANLLGGGGKKTFILGCATHFTCLGPLLHSLFGHLLGHIFGRFISRFIGSSLGPFLGALAWRRLGEGMIAFCGGQNFRIR